MRKDAGTKSDVLVQVAIVEAIPAKLEFRRLNVGEVSVKDSERVELGDVMTSHLVSTNEKLNLQMVIEFATTSAGMQSRSAIGWRRNETRRRLKGFGARQTLVQSPEIRIPRSMYRAGVLPPMSVHFFCVISVGSICENIVR